MVTNASAAALIKDVVDELQANQTTRAKKANTVTSAIGTVATILLSGVAYWIESTTDAPSWIPGVVFILGMLATTFGVSQTKNGITDSVATDLKTELAHQSALGRVNLRPETETLGNPPIVPPEAE